MFREIEKKLNARIINMLTIGTTIEKSHKKKRKKRGIKKLFKDGLQQMEKDIKKEKKSTTNSFFRQAKPKKKSFREKLGLKKKKPKKKSFREKLGFKD